MCSAHNFSPVFLASLTKMQSTARMGTDDAFSRIVHFNPGSVPNLIMTLIRFPTVFFSATSLSIICSNGTVTKSSRGIIEILSCLNANSFCSVHHPAQKNPCSYVLPILLGYLFCSYWNLKRPCFLWVTSTHGHKLRPQSFLRQCRYLLPLRPRPFLPLPLLEDFSFPCYWWSPLLHIYYSCRWVRPLQTSMKIAADVHMFSSPAWSWVVPYFLLKSGIAVSVFLSSPFVYYTALFLIFCTILHPNCFKSWTECHFHLSFSNNDAYLLL